jgi:hypothetical protein
MAIKPRYQRDDSTFDVPYPAVDDSPRYSLKCVLYAEKTRIRRTQFPLCIWSHNYIIVSSKSGFIMDSYGISIAGLNYLLMDSGRPEPHPSDLRRYS